MLLRKLNGASHVPVGSPALFSTDVLILLEMRRVQICSLRGIPTVCVKAFNNLHV